MTGDGPRTNPRHEPEHVYERGADPAEVAGRPLVSKNPHEPLSPTDEPDPERIENRPDPHHRLNTPVGTPDPTADSDPYREADPEEDADTASGTTGAHQGAES